MATYEQAMAALRKADAAGNADDARQLAQIAAKLKPANSEGASAPTPESGRADDSGYAPSRLEAMKALAEVAATLGTGAIVEPAAGLAGLAQGALSRRRGEGDVNARMTDRIRQVEDLTYSPKSKTAQAFLSAAGKVLEPLDALAKGVGRAAQDVGLGAAGGAAAETAVNFLPGAFGFRGVRPALAERAAARRAIGDIERSAAEQGIDINAPGALQREQIAEAASRQTGGQASRGEPFPGIREGIIERKAAEKGEVDRLYTDARGTKAGLRGDGARELSGRVKAAIAEKEFDVETMPILNRRLDEIGRLEKLPAGSAIKLSAIDAYRRRLGQNRAPATDGSQNLALDTIKRTLDGFMDEAFDADMIRGDPAAIQKWKDARAASSAYQARFKGDKFIRDMAKIEATPEQMRQWVFGASAVGAKPQAALAVRSIGDIVGKDSPQFAALRQDALFDVMEPLLRKEPSLQQFARNYDRLVRNNPSLVKELFPESGKGLRDLRVVAEAVEKRAPDNKMLDLNRMGAVALFGHGISRAAMKVSLATQAFARLRSAGSTSEKRRILGEVVGYDTAAPLIPKRALLYGSAVPVITGEIERQSGQRQQ